MRELFKKALIAFFVKKTKKKNSDYFSLMHRQRLKIKNSAHGAAETHFSFPSLQKLHKYDISLSEALKKKDISLSEV